MPTKLSLYLQPRAFADLEEIFKYTIKEWFTAQAIKYQDDLYDYMNLICEQPTIGIPYPFTKKEYRKLNVEKHIILYRIENQQIMIVRILHGQMNYNDHL